MAFEWDAAAFARLEKLWNEGHSAAEIGRRMGISKNSAISAARRRKLGGRADPIIRLPADEVRQRNERVLKLVGTGKRVRWVAGHLNLNRRTVERIVSEARSDGWRPGRAPGAAVETLPPLASLAEAPPEVVASRPASACAEPAAAPFSLVRRWQPGRRQSPVYPVADRPMPARDRLAEPSAPDPNAERLAGVTFRARRSSPCCWPIGEPGTRGYRTCDAPADGGRSYCADHAAIAYVTPRDRMREAADAR